MTDFRGKFPKIVWNGNTLTFSEPLEKPVTWPQDRPGTEVAEAPSGTRDAWHTGSYWFLAAVVRRVPRVSGTSVWGHSDTGWEGATGWAAFLEWARKGNTFAFYPDKDAGTSFTCYLLEPGQAQPQPSLEEDGTRRFSLKIRTTDGTEITGY